MARFLSEVTSRKRAVLYDELSHMNPRYASPLLQEHINIEQEVVYHERNLILLSLYFDYIVVLTGNILNFTNFLTQEVVSRVSQTDTFTKLVRSNIIVFSGWGARLTKDAISNQADYAKIFKPDLKSAEHISHIQSLAASTDLFFRESGVGEEDLVKTFFSKFRVHEMIFDEKEYRSVFEAANLAQDQAAHLGTLNFFPLINEHIHRNERRRKVYDIFFDTWLEYSANRYVGIFTYDPAAGPLNPLRPASSVSGSRVLAATLSPYVFERFLLANLSNSELKKLFAMPIDRLIALRNGDWKSFADAYHYLAESLSQEISSFDERKMLSDLDDRSLLWDQKISGIIKGDSGVDIDSIVGFVATIVGSAAALPGLAYITKGFSVRARREVRRITEKFFVKIQKDPVRPFLIKLHQSLT